MIFIAGLSIAVFIEILLISKRNKSEPDIILMLWMFLISVHLFLFYMGFTNEFFNYPFLLGIGLPIPLLHGVFLYFYVGSTTNQLPKNRNVLWLHFLPATFFYIYLIDFFMLPADQKIQVYRNQGAGYEVFETIRFYAIALSGILYVIWSSFLLRRHRRHIRNQFSNLEKINLRWLKFLTWGMGCIWLLVIFVRPEIFTFGGVVIFVFLIAFFGIRQPGIFTPDRPKIDDDVQKEKYSKSGLTEESSEKFYQALKRLMDEEAAYRESDLSLGELASRLGIHPNYLSQIINEREGKNFFDFVNTYRIEEFKRLIANPKNQRRTLLSLAYDCGFNSKSSFNRFFKKATGHTPTQYLTLVSKGIAS